MKTMLALLLLVVPASAQEAFEITTRQDWTVGAVPMVRPTGDNRVIALDVIPNGNPTPIKNMGYAWVHVCNVDVKLYPTAPMECAGVKMTADGVVFSADVFNGAPRRPIRMMIGPTTVATFSANPVANLTVGGFDALQMQRRIAHLESQVKQLGGKP